MDYRQLENLSNNLPENGPANRLWSQYQHLGRLAEQVGHNLLAVQLYGAAMQICIDEDYEKLCRKHAFKAQESARSLDRLVSRILPEEHPHIYITHVYGCYEDIWWLQHGE